MDTRAEDTPRKILAGMSALILEDYALTFRALRRLLKNAGCHRVLGAESAAEGLELLTDFEPDVMFVDIKLGDGKPTGIDFLAEARARGCDSVAIIYSVYLSKELYFRATLAGADYYMVKDSGLSVIEEIAHAVAHHTPVNNDGRSSKPDLDEGMMRSTRVTLRERELLEAWVEYGCPPIEQFAYSIGKEPKRIRRIFSLIYRKLGLEGVSELAHIVTSCAMMASRTRRFVGS